MRLLDPFIDEAARNHDDCGDAAGKEKAASTASTASMARTARTARTGTGTEAERGAERLGGYVDLGVI